MPLISILKGHISNRRVFIDLTAESFYPDGRQWIGKARPKGVGLGLVLSGRRQRDDASNDARPCAPDFLHFWQ